MTGTLPMRVFLQIREGVLNEVGTFDIKIVETTAADPNAIGAKLAHSIDNSEIARALRAAAAIFEVDA